MVRTMPNGQKFYTENELAVAMGFPSATVGRYGVFFDTADYAKNLRKWKIAEKKKR